jgi:hypothetical protein
MMEGVERSWVEEKTVKTATTTRSIPISASLDDCRTARGRRAEEGGLTVK